MEVIWSILLLKARLNSNLGQIAQGLVKRFIRCSQRYTAALSGTPWPAYSLQYNFLDLCCEFFRLEHVASVAQGILQILFLLNQN